MFYPLLCPTNFRGQPKYLVWLVPKMVENSSMHTLKHRNTRAYNRQAQVSVRVATDN